VPSIRTQIYLTKEQRRRLDERGSQQRRSLAELIRERDLGACPRLTMPSRDEWDRG